MFTLILILLALGQLLGLCATFFLYCLGGGQGDNAKEVTLYIVASIVWPITAICVLIYFFYVIAWKWRWH